MKRQHEIEWGASLWRFVLLFVTWGVVAFQFKVFMDLTVRGLILSAAFFAASISATIGYKTRLSMAVLAASLVVHGMIFRHNPSFAFGALAAVSAVLPIGAFYSLDRYLKNRPNPAPYQPVGAPIHWLTRYKRPIVFVALAFMLGGPAYNQMFHHTSKRVLSWDMFHEIGKDLVVVRFSTVEGGSRHYINYLEVLGHKLQRFEVRRNHKVLPDLRIVGTDQLAVVVQRTCAASPNPAALRLEAKIATVETGWRQLYSGNEPICKAQPTGAEA